MIKDSPAGLAECPCPGFRDKEVTSHPAWDTSETQPPEAAEHSQDNL